MNEPPDDGARRAQPEKDGSAGLNAKTPSAFCGGLRITGHVKDAARNPGQAQHGRDGIADIDRKRSQRGQENRHPFQRVHLHAKHPLKIGIARYGRHLDAEGNARLRHLDRGEEVERDCEAGDEGRAVIHCENPP